MFLISDGALGLMNNSESQKLASFIEDLSKCYNKVCEKVKRIIKKADPQSNLLKM